MTILEKLELCLVDGMDEVRLATVQSVLASAKENLDCVSDRVSYIKCYFTIGVSVIMVCVLY